MENIVGFGLMAFFAWLGYSTTSYTPHVYAQMLISGVGGAYLLIGGNLDKIKSLVAGIKAGVPVKAVDTTVEYEPVKTSDEALKDFQSISYIRDRSVEIASPESVDMTVQINTALFKSRIK